MVLVHCHAPDGAWFSYAERRLKVLCFLLVLLLLGRYRSFPEKQALLPPADPTTAANQWIYDSMKRYYYWADQLPEHPDYSLPTPAFFKDLLAREDRFSRISNQSEAHTPKTTVGLYGFQYAFIRHPFNQQQLVGVITQVLANSYAGSKLRLKRGMFFTQVNNKVLTEKSMPAVVKDLESDANSYAMLQLAALNAAGTAFADSERVAVKQAAVHQRSVFAIKYFNKNGIKTGYLPYYYCLEKDDGILLERVLSLKTERVTELILDLRYNSGGSVASVSKLAATLVPSFNAGKPFITYKGNQHGGTVKLSFKDAVQFSGEAYGKDMRLLQSLNLGLKRIFILVSPATASAAELLANNLKPYMPVKLIGERTLGKDEASFVIEDIRTPRQVEWRLDPIVYKVANADGKGDYSKGLSPDHAVNEFSKLPLAELGTPGDLPVDKALELIYGTSVIDATPRPVAFSFPQARPVFYSSQSGIVTVNAPN